jgi:phage repressor protein C with HTH and peptisase S24 domain
MDDALMVKRLAMRPAQRLSVLSDNPAYPGWPDVDADAVTIIGRVIWAGRKIS